jgi:hypothetical protein
MIHAYQEIYLNNAQAALGEAFDYAVNTCNISGENFVKMFLVSSVSKKMENGEPKYITGKSGIEIVREIVLETMGKTLEIEPIETTVCSHQLLQLLGTLPKFLSLRIHAIGCN